MRASDVVGMVKTRESVGMVKVKGSGGVGMVNVEKSGGDVCVG